MNSQEHGVRTVESEKLLFEVLSTFRENRELSHQLVRRTSTNVMRLQRGQDQYGQEWLQDLTLLMLYHGTELSPRELISLRVGDLDREESQQWRIRSPLKDEWFIFATSNELSSVLEAFQTSRSKDPKALLFHGHIGEALTEMDILRLVERFSENPPQGTIAPYFSLSADDFAVIPTPLRLNANPRYTGKGVAIAFIDSGFYPHPDLIKPRNRILAYVDMADMTAGWSELAKPDIVSWHGMQTSVVACGNGHLSQGLYRGIASDADVVLIKASSKGPDKSELISAAIGWAIEHKNHFNIKIINISLGTAPTVADQADNPVNKAVSEAVAAGIVVIAAAGNDPRCPPTPPANAISAITVGGTDDQNMLFKQSLRMYHSSYGLSVEGILKPEIIAPAIWIAAPVLPESPLYYESLVLQKLIKASERELPELYEQNKHRLRVKLKASKVLRPKAIRTWAEKRTIEEKLIATHYQHVDGTSFAAPITASVVAQMLEVNPGLSAENIKKILLATARRIEGVSPFVQGHGVISPSEAVEAALSNSIPLVPTQSASPHIFKNYVTFTYFDPEAERVDVVGDFNQWQEGVTPMVREANGQWKVTKEFFLPGRYHYKFLVNGTVWVHDPANSQQENDGYNGHNSIFSIYTPGNTEDIFEKFLKTIRIFPATTTADRKPAFLELDQILQSPLSNKSYRVRQFFSRCMTIALEEIEQEQIIDTDQIKLWQFYNQGYVVKTSSLTMAFDLVTTRHVYNVFWDLEPTIVSAFADLIDILFVTHRHPDHFDLELINTMIGKGKRVIIPHELISLVPRGAIGLKPDEIRTFAFPTKQDESLHVIAHKGLHVYDQGRNIPHRVYEIETANRFSLLHLGDHDYTSSVLNTALCHVGFVKIGSISPDFDDISALTKLTRQVTFNHLIAGHLNELGHPVKGGRISYEAAFDCLKSIAVPSAVLAWGEALTVDRQTTTPHSARRDLSNMNKKIRRSKTRTYSIASTDDRLEKE